MNFRDMMRCVSGACCAAVMMCGGVTVIKTDAMNVEMKDAGSSNTRNRNCCLAYDHDHGVGYYWLDNDCNLLKEKASLEEVLACISTDKWHKKLPTSKTQFDSYIEDLLSCQTGEDVQRIIDCSFHHIDAEILFACIENHDALDPLLDELTAFLNWLKDYELDESSVINYMPIKKNIAHGVLSLWDSCIRLPSIVTENSLDKENFCIDYLIIRINDLNKKNGLPLYPSYF